MKTAKEKAEEFLMNSGCTWEPEFYKQFVSDIERLLKEQDRDTRQACASGFLKRMEEEVLTPNQFNDQP